MVNGVFRVISEVTPLSLQAAPASQRETHTMLCSRQKILICWRQDTRAQNWENAQGHLLFHQKTKTELKLAYVKVNVCI